jgi:hypothetical protein
MAKENLETKTKAVLDIRQKVNRIYEILKDVGMKLTHVIERKGNYYSVPDGFDYKGEYAS